MKKKIISFLFVGAIAFVSMGFQHTISSANASSDSVLRIVKGQAINSDRDHEWDYVTFGLTGINCGEYSITFVDIMDKKGELIGHVDNIKRLNKDECYAWYAVGLSQFGIHKDFTLEVHVTIDPRQSTSTVISTQKAYAPIDPDETILIVKYP